MLHYDPCRLVRQVKQFGKLIREGQLYNRPLPACPAGETVGVANVPVALLAAQTASPAGQAGRGRAAHLCTAI